MYIPRINLLKKLLNKVNVEAVSNHGYCLLFFEIKEDLNGINKLKNKDIENRWYLGDMLLSLEAKGLLTLIFSLPERVCLSVELLTSMSCNDEKETADILNELMKLKYIIYIKDTDTYLIYEKPYIEK